MAAIDMSLEELGVPVPSHPGQYDALLPIFRYKTCIAELGILKFFIEYRIFDAMPEDGDISVHDLATKTNVDASLLERFSNFLVSVRILASPAPGRVALTPVSARYRHEGRAAMHLLHTFDLFLVPVAQWPQYFEQNGPVEPKKAQQAPISHAFGHPGKSLYELIDTLPGVVTIFNKTMAGAGAGAGMPVSGMYNFQWVGEVASTTTDEAAAQRPLIVDVGGGKGQALKVILKENPRISPSRCVLVDRPEPIQESTKEDDIELREVQKVTGNFHDEQPIKGALIYHIRRVLNDWPDDDVVKILGHISSACASDSRVLISEPLLVTPPKAFNAMHDIVMLSLGGKRRDENMYGEIASKVGLRVNAVFRDENSETGIIELVLV